MNKYVQIFSFVAITPFDVTSGNFCQSNKLTGAVVNISDNLKSKSQRVWSPHDQIWSQLQFWSHHTIQTYQSRTFISHKDLFGQCEHFLRCNGQRSSSPHDNIWAKVQFWIHNSIQCTRWHFFVNGKKLTGTVLSISEIWGSEVKVIRWSNMDKNAGLEPSLYFQVPGSNFVYWKHLLEQCWAFLEIWGL